MRIATTIRATASILVGAAAALGIVLYLKRPGSQPPTPPDIPVSSQIALAPEPELETSSSSVQSEQPAPVAPPFYASLFVAGRTWDLPCFFRADVLPSREEKPISIERCHVDSVNITPTGTSARIACWDVHDGESRPPDPAINTYVMTGEGLFINTDHGTPLFTPHPVAKPLPRRWGQDPPDSMDGMHADAVVRHHGAWCSIHEVETWDTSFGTTDCISERGIVGTRYHRDFGGEDCGDVP